MSDKKCKIEGCNNTNIRSKGLCGSHYWRYRRYGTFEELKLRREILSEKGLSYCPRCNLEKPFKEFHVDKHTFTGLAIYCKSCNSKKGKLRYKEHKNEHINNRLKKKFGLTLEEYNVKFKSQNQKCAICKKSNNTKKMFPIDHCHKTNKIRGILCTQCNSGLGHFYDNTEFLQSAIEYLKNSQPQYKNQNFNEL